MKTPLRWFSYLVELDAVHFVDFCLYILAGLSYWLLMKGSGAASGINGALWWIGFFGWYGAVLLLWRYVCRYVESCFIKAAEQGHVLAQYTLGVMYKEGYGVRHGYAEAAKWLRKAAEQGHVLAQYTLGVMYKEGHRVPHDYAEAAKWLRKAAEQGHVLAQYTLGVMYENGWGVPEDKVLAYALYNLVAAGDPSEKSKASQSRARIAKAFGRDELAQGQALTREFTKPGYFGKALDAWLAKRSQRIR